MGSPLYNQVYRHLFAAQVIALTGTGLSTVALTLLAYDLAGRNAGEVLGAALALKMIAYVGIAPIVADKAEPLEMILSIQPINFRIARWWQQMSG